MNASATSIDFHTAFGRLLRDGLLRDAHALNALAVVGKMAVRERDRPALIQLVPEDLEYQAVVLLRKRLDALRHMLPETIRQLGGQTWPVFYKYARTHWPAGNDPVVQDAYDFGRYVRQKKQEAICFAEWNRLEFLVKEKWISFHWVQVRMGTSDVSRKRKVLQWLFRFPLGARRRHEMILQFKL